MKQILIALVAFAAIGVWGQTDKKEPRSEFTINDFLAAGYRVSHPEPEPIASPKAKLGTIDKWRYETCQTEAAKAPTSQSVFQGMRVCREKFGQ